VDTSTAVDELDRLTAELPEGGERRDGQRQMCGATADAIASGRHLVVQAGTGTGKSLAYLVPAALSGETVVIATATKALQDQLAHVDLPFLAEHLDRPVSVAVLKGRSNYACRQRIQELLDADSAQLALDGVNTEDTSAEVGTLIAWADESISGDRADLDFEPSNAAWDAVSVSSRECPGRSRCPSGNVCFAEMARTKAAAADLVVINTHLLGLHIAAEAAILPPHSVVIVDEAHQFEEVVTATSGASISAGRFRNLARTARAILEDPPMTQAVEDAAVLIGDQLEPLAGKRTPADGPPQLTDALVLARQRSQDLATALRDLPDNPDTDARKQRAVLAASALIDDIDAVLSPHTTDVIYVEDGPGPPSLRLSPLEVGRVLEPTLFADTTVILTSATIPANLPTALGIPEGEFDAIDVGSPFDYENQAVLYCAAHLPDPRSAHHSEALVEELEELIVAAGGRTLGLFTSWRMMDLAAEALESRLPWTLYTQRDLPKPKLIEAFREDRESILFATMGFWQGIDVPGNALSLVTIDRLPFARPDDPLLEARREHAGSNAFRTVDLPRAATMLAQGAGRLIRRTTDRGVVAVLDQRLATARSYRWEIISALPAFRRTSDKDETLSYLRGLRDEAGQ
jgi:ATP-dependent DNA helicase DinG